MDHHQQQQQQQEAAATTAPVAQVTDYHHQQEQVGSGGDSSSSAMTTEKEHAEAVDLDEWALVDEQAEIVASVSTSSAPREHVEEEKTAPTQAENEQQSVHTTQMALTEHELTQREELQRAPANEPEGSRDHEAAQRDSTAAEDVDTTSAEVHFDAPEGYLRIRLRAGEQIRPAWFKATQIVDDFVAEFFADAVAEGRKVRLIYMGMLLIHDRSMGEYGIEEDGVIHCVITEAPPTPHRQASQQSLESKGFANPANTLLVITGVFLYGLWSLLYHYPHFFSWKSIFLLSLFSATHVSAMVSRFSTASSS